MFNAIAIDSDDEDTKVVKKTTTEKKTGAAEKKAPVQQKPVPGAAPKVIPGLNKPKAPAPAPAPEPEPVAVDPDTQKVNDRGGKIRDRHGSGRGGKPTPNDHRAHPRRHDYDITGRAGKDGSRGGRGPGGWGSAADEAQRAEKNPGAVTEESGEPVEESTPEEVEEVAPEPTVFGLDDYLTRRNTTLRANEELFGSVKERVVSADPTLKVLKKEEDEVEESTKGAKKSQRSTNKTSLDAAFTVAPAVTYVPRERTEGGRGGRGRGEGRGRGDGRGRGGRGAGRGAGTKLQAEDFPAL